MTVSIPRIIRDVWTSRELIGQFVRRDLTVRYSQASMGVLWAILNPALVVMSGLLIRLAMSQAAGAKLDGAIAVSIAIRSLPWTFFAGAMALSTASIVSHSNLISKVFFVREAVPLSSVIGQLVDTTIGSAMMVVVVLLIGTPLSVEWLWIVPCAVMLVLFTTGVSLILSCANLFFRDVKYLVQVAINFGLFATPIFFGPEMLGQRGAQLMLLFPVALFVQGFGIASESKSLLRQHDVVVHGQSVVTWPVWGLPYLLAVSVITLALGLVVFRKFSGRFAESI
jgi:lipopolysaccharide transport system permease protein